MKGEQFASLWAKADNNGFKTDLSNAVLTWVDGEDVKEAELVITGARFDGSSITYTREYSAKSNRIIKGGQSVCGWVECVNGKSSD
jgi:hypothetical protein